jgi:hypothetical protein
LIVDHKHQGYRNSRCFKKEGAFRTKILNRGNGQYQDVLPLAQKIHDITDVSCRLLFDNPTTQDYKGWEAEGLTKEAKVCFIHFSCFASSAPPSSTVPGPP